MRTLASLLAVAAIAAFGFAGTAQASHKGFSHGVTSNNSGGGNSVDVTIVCTFDISDGTLTIDSAVLDVTGDGATFNGTINVNVQAFDKGDGDANFALSGAVLRNGENVPFAASDDFGGLTFAAEEDLTGVVTVTEVAGSLNGRTLFATCDSDDITVQA